MTDKDRRTAWQAIAMQPAWTVCQQDLTLFCTTPTKDTGRDCGLLSALAYVLDSIHNPTPDEET